MDEIVLDKYLIWDRLYIKDHWTKTWKIVAFDWVKKVLIDLPKWVF